MIECPQCESHFKGLACECGYRVPERESQYSTTVILPLPTPHVHVEIPPCHPMRAWAHRLKARHESGEKLDALQIKSYREALSRREAK